MIFILFSGYAIKRLFGLFIPERGHSKSQNVCKNMPVGLPIVLFHDATGERAGSFLLGKNCVRVIEANKISEIRNALLEVEEESARGYFIGGFVCYESACSLDKAFSTKKECSLPFLWFGIFEEYERVQFNNHDNVTKFPNDMRWSPSISEARYQENFEKIKGYIKAGDCYQVNYSYHLRGEFSHKPCDFFLSRVIDNPPPYCALIQTDKHAIMSFSPELFFTLSGDNIICKPMKGTIKRGRTLQEDYALSNILYHSEKDRAENLMIVDMARNDLGKIAEVGSVKVKRLFEIEKYETLYQMTSTVTAKTKARLSEMFQALFPAASITGAPKARAMEIINELEHTPRGIYTGSMGYILPGGDTQFNVAIRTLCVNLETKNAEYGVGSGIVWDSILRHEIEECLVKTKALMEPPKKFRLLETMLWCDEKESLSDFHFDKLVDIPKKKAGRGNIVLFDEHLKRLRDSAEYFNFIYDEDLVRNTIERKCLSLESGKFRIRLLLDRDGEIEIQTSQIFDKDNFLVFDIATNTIDSNDVFVYHKTNFREFYEKAIQQHPECDEVILVNEKGELTEGTKSNIILRIKHHWYTPPIASGLLGGVFRNYLVKKGKIKERVLYTDDLEKASEVFFVNSVRGLQPALHKCKINTFDYVEQST